MPIILNQPEPILPETVLVHGPFGSGKTVLAATLSDLFPKDAKSPFHIRPHVELTDMIWLKADTDAMTGFGEIGLRVPVENIIDFSHVEPVEIIKSLNEVVGLVKGLAEKIAKKGQAPKLVVDTLGVIDTLIVAHWSKVIEANIEEDSGKQRSDNNFALWRAVLNTHTPFFAKLKAVNCRKLFLCHQGVKGDFAKSNNPEINKQQERKRTAMGFAEGAVGAAITGKAWDFYHQQCSLVMAIEKIVKRDAIKGTAVSERILRPHGKADIVTKTRYNCLAEIEPADFRVINNKITEAKK